MLKHLRGGAAGGSLDVHVVRIRARGRSKADERLRRSWAQQLFEQIRARCRSGIGKHRKGIRLNSIKLKDMISGSWKRFRAVGVDFCGFRRQLQGKKNDSEKPGFSCPIIRWNGWDEASRHNGKNRIDLAAVATGPTDLQSITRQKKKVNSETVSSDVVFGLYFCLSMK